MPKFRSEVERYGDFETSEDARDAAEATLHVLGTHIARGESQSIAKHLPPEPGNWLVPPADGQPIALDAQDFVEYVASQTDVPTHEAWGDCEAVLAALVDQVPRKDARGIVTELPREYNPLFAKADIDVPEGPA